MNTAKFTAAATKDQEVGFELHAAGCADIKKGKREVLGHFDSAAAAAEDYYADMISEGSMSLDEAMIDVQVMPCAKAVR